MTGAASGECLVVIGEPGTGKTLLLQSLDQNLRERRFNVRQLRSGDTLASVTKTEILLVDEADLLEADKLKRICRLPNPIIMAGLPGLAAQLSVCPRPYRAERLERLGPEDIARFVRFRLDASDAVHPVFTPQAVLALMRQSAGLFRLVTILAGAALFLAEQRGSPEVAATDVDEAALLRAGALEVPDTDFSPTTVDEPAALVAQDEPIDPATWRPGRRTRTIVGWTGWLGASVGVVMAAIVLARAAIQVPPLHMAEASPSPMTALFAAPAIATSEPLELSPHPRVLAFSPSPLPDTASPEPTMASLPSAPQPLASPVPLATVATPEPRQSGSQQFASQDAKQSPSLHVFSGPITNDTMGQTGKLSLRMMTTPVAGPIGALFHASHGLIGSGLLSGTMSPNGAVRLEGRLMMGRNSFTCELLATLQGDRLFGEATFIHVATGSSAHSRFNLSRL